MAAGAAAAAAYTCAMSSARRRGGEDRRLHFDAKQQPSRRQTFQHARAAGIRVQIIFGKQLAEVLAADGNEVVIVRPLLNPAATIATGFREIRLETLAAQSDVFEAFSRVEQRVIFEQISASTFWELGEQFTRLNNATCHGRRRTSEPRLRTCVRAFFFLEQITNAEFLRAIEAERFDLFYVAHHFNCALAVVRRAGVRYVRFSSAVLGRALAAPAGLWPMPSVVPGEQRHKLKQLSKRSL